MNENIPRIENLEEENKALKWEVCKIKKSIVCKDTLKRVFSDECRSC